MITTYLPSCIESETEGRNRVSGWRLTCSIKFRLSQDNEYAALGPPQRSKEVTIISRRFSQFMKRLCLSVLVVFASMSFAMAQNTPFPTAGTPPTLANGAPTFNTALGADVLGAHNGYGRGCVMCHAPHSGSLGNGKGTSSDPQNG